MSLFNNNTHSPSQSTEIYNPYISPEALGTSDESLLGIYCQNCHPPTPTQERIAERYYLQTLARELLPTERTAQCLRSIAPFAHEVEIWRNAETETAHYRNLLTCGRVWFCPVCSAKITEQRAQELQRFAVHWTQERGSMALVTYTIRHNKTDTLENLLDILKTARRKFTQSKQWRKIKDSVMWYGSVTTTEVNNGVKFGWHPHLHELVFFEFDMKLEKLNLPDLLKKRWQSAVRKAGGDAGYTAGVDYRDANTEVYRYIAKYGHQPSTNSWTIDREVTKAVSKRAKEGSRTPWQLLDDYGQGDIQSGRLFQEYAKAIKGRNQLVWSRELKSEYTELAEQTDAELAEQTDNNSEFWRSLSRKQWYDLMQLPRDVRGEILTIAGQGDKARLTDFLLDNGITLDIEF